MSKAAAASRSNRKDELGSSVCEEKPDQYFSRALEKGLQALEDLAQAPGGIGLMEEAAKLKLTKPSAFRILRTLESLGYIGRTGDGKYVLAGGGARQLPVRAVQTMLKHGSGLLRNLALGFRETASMAALFGNHIEVILVSESPQLIRMGNTVGRILPPHASSLGKAITAFLDRDTQEHIMRTYGMAAMTPHTITDELALQREFERIRAQRHAEDWEESAPGGACFASPILQPGDIAVGAISVSMPKMRLEGAEHQRRIIDAVRQTAVEISTAAFGTV